MATAPVIVTNGSNGLQITNGSLPCQTIHQLTPKSVRTFDVSADGRFLVWPDVSSADPSTALIKVFNLESGAIHLEIVVKSVPQFVKISPKATSIASWFPFRSVKAGEQEAPNLFIHDVSNGNLRSGIICKKQSKWEPEWSHDEQLCARLNNAELLFYEKDNYDRWVHRMETQKTANFALTTNSRKGQKYVACYSGPAAAKGQASFVRIYRYPGLGNAIANKSFFKADSVNLCWSPGGDALLFLCVSDVDKSGKSYYGEQKLHLLEASASGQSYTVSLKKDGPIHAVSWIPTDPSSKSSSSSSSNYIIIYGFIPARVSIFDLKGSIIFDFNGAEMKVNQIVFNPFGNVVALAGFGNLRGGVSVWDLEKKNKISEFLCPETTDISWSPDGLSLLTATTAPRLRVGNGFKLWTYGGNLLFENTFAMNVELYKICWQQRPGIYSKPQLVTEFNPQLVKQQSASSSLASGGVVAASRYIPPSKRSEAEREKLKMQEMAKVDPVKEKKIQAVNKKLTEISKLKQQQSMGAELKAQQIQKIEQENTLRRELAELKL